MGRHVTSYEIAMAEYGDLRKQYGDAISARLDTLRKAVSGETGTAADEVMDQLRKCADHLAKGHDTGSARTFTTS